MGGAAGLHGGGDLRGLRGGASPARRTRAAPAATFLWQTGLHVRPQPLRPDAAARLQAEGTGRGGLASGAPGRRSGSPEPRDAVRRRMRMLGFVVWTSPSRRFRRGPAGRCAHGVTVGVTVPGWRSSCDGWPIYAVSLCHAPRVRSELPARKWPWGSMLSAHHGAPAATSPGAPPPPRSARSSL